MVVEGQTTIGLLDLSITGIGRYTQHLISRLQIVLAHTQHRVHLVNTHLHPLGALLHGCYLSRIDLSVSLRDEYQKVEQLQTLGIVHITGYLLTALADGIAKLGGPYPLLFVEQLV